MSYIRRLYAAALRVRDHELFGAFLCCLPMAFLIVVMVALITHAMRADIERSEARNKAAIECVKQCEPLLIYLHDGNECFCDTRYVKPENK